MDRKNQERNNLAIKNQIYNQTCVKYIRTHVLELCRGRFFLEKSIYLPVLVILSYCPTHFSLVFQPTLYKFIVLGFLGLSPFIPSWAPNLVLTTIKAKQTPIYFFESQVKVWALLMLFSCPLLCFKKKIFYGFHVFFKR